MSAVPSGAAASGPGTQPAQTLEPSPGPGAQVGWELWPLGWGWPTAALGPPSLEPSASSYSDIPGGQGTFPFLKQAQRLWPHKAQEEDQEGMARAPGSWRSKPMTTPHDEETTMQMWDLQRALSVDGGQMVGWGAGR